MADNKDTTLEAYARHREKKYRVSYSRAAVSKAIRQGRLRDSVTRGDDGAPRIPDFDRADTEWDARTDTTRHPSRMNAVALARTHQRSAGVPREERLDELFTRTGAGRFNVVVVDADEIGVLIDGRTRCMDDNQWFSVSAETAEWLAHQLLETAAVARKWAAEGDEMSDQPPPAA